MCNVKIMHSNIPPDIKTHVLPNPNLPIFQFLAFPLPPISLPGFSPKITDYLTADPPNNDNIDSIRNVAIPPQNIVASLAAHIDKHDTQSIKIPHIPLIKDDHFPIWIVQFRMLTIASLLDLVPRRAPPLRPL